MSEAQFHRDADLLADFESGSITPADALRLFSTLVRVGVVKIASDLLAAGVLSPTGEVHPSLGLCPEGGCQIAGRHFHAGPGSVPRLRLVSD